MAMFTRTVAAWTVLATYEAAIGDGGNSMLWEMAGAVGAPVLSRASQDRQLLSKLGCQQSLLAAGGSQTAAMCNCRLLPHFEPDRLLKIFDCAAARRRLQAIKP